MNRAFGWLPGCRLFFVAVIGGVCLAWMAVTLGVQAGGIDPWVGLAAGVGASALATFVACRQSSRALHEVAEQVRDLSSRAGLRSHPSCHAHLGELAAIHQGLAAARGVLARRAAAEREALREACMGHDLLASVVAGTADMIYVKDTEFCFVLVNAAARARVPRPWEEWQLIGHRATELLGPELAAAEEALERQVIATGETRSSVVDWPGTAGAPRYVALTRSAWRDIDGVTSGVVTVGRDVTEQRTAERRLATTQAHLLRATRLSAMGAMATGLAHELNQPLAAAGNFIAAAGRLLDQGLAPPGSPSRASLDDAGAQVRRTADIVRRIAGFVERGEAELRVDDAGSVTREACEIARAEGLSSDARLELTVGAEPCMALLDRTQMQQVLLNLIRNAAEALHPGTDGRISVGCATNNEGVWITVADNGPGLGPEIAARLFQPFVSSKPHGMGIGLAICRTIVEGHGGMLSAASVPGGGAVFTVRLPKAGWWEDGRAETAGVAVLPGTPGGRISRAP